MTAIDWIAHGGIVGPLTWDELARNLVIFLVTIGSAVAFTLRIVWPVVRDADLERRQELVGWGALAAFVVLGMSWWLTRQSVTEAVAPPPRAEEHQHYAPNGGQVAMWGDYHVELARVVSGEYRLWLTDAYRRAIAPEHWQAEVFVREDGELSPEGVPMEAGLGGNYRFALLPQDAKDVQVRVGVPGWNVKLNFVFDESRGKRTLPMWCGPGG